MPTTLNRDQLAQLSDQTIESAFEVHRALGPGLSKAPYLDGLCLALGKRGVPHRRQVWLPDHYKNLTLSFGHSLDLLVGDAVIVDVLVEDAVTPEHEARMLEYLRISGRRLGLLINFNAHSLRDGLKRLYYDNALPAAC
jgi:GxxExxY protein